MDFRILSRFIVNFYKFYQHCYEIYKNNLNSQCKLKRLEKNYNLNLKNYKFH
jgi:hypothetical protein